MISIIIPIYNAEQYLPIALDSCLSQSYKELQIICVNDGSSDNSETILHEYAAKDKRVEIISQTNQGLSSARNTGLQAVKGDFVSFLDADDWLDADTFEKALNHQQETQADVVLWGYIKEYDTRSVPVNVWKENQIFEGSLMEELHCRLIAPGKDQLSKPELLDSLGVVWGKLYKASLFRQCPTRFVDTKEIGSAEDVLFNIRLFSRVKKAIYVNDIFTHYRKSNSASFTSCYKPQLIRQWNCLFRHMEREVSALSYQAKAKLRLKRRKAMSIIGLGLNILRSPQGTVQRYAKLTDLVNSTWYRESVKELPLNPFPLHWKLFFGCAKFKITPILYPLLCAIKHILSK